MRTPVHTGHVIRNEGHHLASFSTTLQDICKLPFLTALLSSLSSLPATTAQFHTPHHKIFVSSNDTRLKIVVFVCLFVKHSAGKETREDGRPWQRRTCYRAT